MLLKRSQVTSTKFTLRYLLGSGQTMWMKQSDQRGNFIPQGVNECVQKITVLYEATVTAENLNNAE